MGIKSLFKNFKSVSGVINTESISAFSEKKIGIDGTGLLYRLYKESEDIQVFKNLLLTFQHFNINATFVIDNHEFKEPLKDDTILSRRHDRDLKRMSIHLFEYILTIKKKKQSVFNQNVYSKVGEILKIHNDFKPNFSFGGEYNISIYQTYFMSELNIMKVIESYKKDIKRPSDKYLKEAYKMIENMKFILFEASKEADFTLGFLYKMNHFDYVYADDSDLLALGVNKLLTNLDLLKMTFDIYDLNLFLEKNKLNQSQFLEICILLGTDYTVPIYLIQKKPQFWFCKDLILKYGSFISIRPHLDTYLSRYPYLGEVNEKYERILEIFTESFDVDEKRYKELQP